MYFFTLTIDIPLVYISFHLKQLSPVREDIGKLINQQFLLIKYDKYNFLQRGKRMTKDDLVTAVVKSCKGDDLSKRLVSDVIDATFESIGKSIKKEKRFSYPAFGTFTVRNRKARKGRNPQTGEEIKIKASKTVGFKPAPTLKSSL